LTRVKKLHWDFNNPTNNNRVAALRVRFMDTHNISHSNEMFIRIPEGGRCEYSSTERTFYVYDSDGYMFRNVHAPEKSAIDISYIGKEYLSIMDLSNSEHQEQLN
jgi:hypothetical protein